MPIDWNAGCWEFECPTCGSSYFNTPNLTRMLRRCKGRLMSGTRRPSEYTGCDFEWPSTDDEKYFRLVSEAPDGEERVAWSCRA